MSRLTCDLANSCVTMAGGPVGQPSILPLQPSATMADNLSFAARTCVSVPASDTVCIPSTLSLLTTTLQPLCSRIDLMVTPPGPMIRPQVSRSYCAVSVKASLIPTSAGEGPGDSAEVIIRLMSASSSESPIMPPAQTGSCPRAEPRHRAWCCLWLPPREP